VANKDENEFCCGEASKIAGCCRIDAILSVDERGQMVLPKEVRDRAKIHAGDKLAVVTMEKGGGVCCITLIKVEDLTEMVKSILGPVMKEVLQD